MKPYPGQLPIVLRSVCSALHESDPGIHDGVCPEMSDARFMVFPLSIHINRRAERHRGRDADSFARLGAFAAVEQPAQRRESPQNGERTEDQNPRRVIVS